MWSCIWAVQVPGQCCYSACARHAKCYQVTLTACRSMQIGSRLTCYLLFAKGSIWCLYFCTLTVTAMRQWHVCEIDGSTRSQNRCIYYQHDRSRNTSAVSLSSCVAFLQGMPAFSAVDIISCLAPSFMIAHKAGLSMATLIACETLVVLPVRRRNWKILRY